MYRRLGERGKNIQKGLVLFCEEEERKGIRMMRREEKKKRKRKGERRRKGTRYLKRGRGEVDVFNNFN